MYTGVIADKIMEYWKLKLIDETIIGNSPITFLFKDGTNDRYKVMVGTDDAHAEEIIDFLNSLLWMHAIDNFDWRAGEEKMIQ